MSRHPDDRTILTVVHKDDRDRLKWVALEDGGLSLTRWIRKCLNDRLETLGEPRLRDYERTP